MNKEAEKWFDSLNEWEKLFVEYLDYAEFGIERNENPTEDNDAPYLVIDRQACWEAEPCASTTDVFEAHPSIVDEIIGNLAEALEEIFNLDDYASIIQIKDLKYDGEDFYYSEAGYYPILRKYVAEGEIKPTQALLKFFEDYSWDIDICELVAFHANEVNIEKFV